MKNILFTLASLLLVSFSVFAGEHPEANFGIYGIQHHPTVADYQQYVGQIVKYLPGIKGEGNYDDEEYFIKPGGSFDKEYIITKISGNDERMSFLLQEKDGKSKVKLVVNNQYEYYSYGKYTYCITDNYTIPLFLVGKFNQDKTKYIGKTFGTGTTQLEVTNALVQAVEWEVGKSHESYPKIMFEITDKADGKKSYVDASNVSNMNELGTEYTNPSFKCKYTVVGITTKSRYNYTLQKEEKIKWYFVKNSISGAQKEVAARTAKIDAFKYDDSGKFIATLEKVEKPTNSAVRYGTTTTVTDKDITKFSYVDNYIDMLIFAANTQFGFILKNISDNTLKIVWNEAVFVDVDGSTSKVMHSGIKYSQREADQPASSIIKGAKLDDIAAPTANVYYSDILKEWTSYSMFRHAEKGKEGQTIKLMLPILVKDVVNEYIFEFGLTYVYNHPEFLAD
jgi:hypothetical protein